MIQLGSLVGNRTETGHGKFRTLKTVQKTGEQRAKGTGATDETGERGRGERKGQSLVGFALATADSNNTNLQRVQWERQRIHLSYPQGLVLLN